MTLLPVEAALLLVLKVTLLLAIAAGTCALLRRSASAASRHMVLTVAAVGVLALPVLSAVLPGYGIPIPAGAGAAALLQRAVSLDVASTANRPEAVRGRTIHSSIQFQSSPTPSRFATAWETPAILLPFLYVVVVLVLLGRLVAGRLALQRIARSAVPMVDREWTQLFDSLKQVAGVSGPVALLRTELPVMPMTWGTLRPVILLPHSAESWTHNRRRAVLLHELSHIARRDCFNQTFSALACAIYWFHPGVWWLARRLRVERELACDDRVLAGGTHAREYAGHLLEIARAHPAPRFAAALAMARPSQLEKRMLAALDDTRERSAPTARIRLIAAAIATAMLSGLAGAQAMVAAQGTVAPDSIPQIVTTSTSTAPLVNASEPNNDVASPRLTGTIPNAPAVDLSRAIESPPLVVRVNPDGQLHMGNNVEPRSAAQAQGGYLAELLATGLPGVDVDAAIRLRRGAVTTEYIRNVLATGLPGIDVETVLHLRHAAVMPDYIAAVMATGLGEITPDDVVALRLAAVTPTYIREMMSTGLEGITVDAAIRLRRAAVMPSFVSGMLSAGMGKLTVDEIIRLRHSGISDE